MTTEESIDMIKDSYEKLTNQLKSVPDDELTRMVISERIKSLNTLLAYYQGEQ